MRIALFVLGAEVVAIAWAPPESDSALDEHDNNGLHTELSHGFVGPWHCGTVSPEDDQESPSSGVTSLAGTKRQRIARILDRVISRARE